MTWSFGLILTAVGAIDIWNVLDIVSRAHAGQETIHGGIDRKSFMSVPMLLFGLYVLISGHDPPPSPPGETPRKTPVKDTLKVIMLIAALVAGIGLIWWAKAELKALGYKEYSLLDGKNEELRKPSWK